MTACQHFSSRAYINHEPCGANIENFDRLPGLPCCVYGQGFCDQHTTGRPKVAAEKMENYTDFSGHNERSDDA